MRKPVVKARRKFPERTRSPGVSRTQTRTFAYDPTTQRPSSETQTETGTTGYTYNADDTLATKSRHGAASVGAKRSGPD